MSDSAASRRGPSLTAAAAVVREKFDHLRELLRRMFQLDRGDLDFGLYRIMKMKSVEVSAFLDEDLLPQVGQSLRLTTKDQFERLEREIAGDLAAARRLGYDIDTTPSSAVEAKRHRLAAMTAMRHDVLAEGDVYHHLTCFFGRYYSDGDFVSLRRHSSGGKSSYLIPYDGEEVKLHWANSDQYYIKTTDNYASYAFHLGSGERARRVRLEIAAADNEKDNIRPSKPKERRFVLQNGPSPMAVVDGELRIRFEHRPLTASEKRRWPGNGNQQQVRVNQAAAERVLKKAPADWAALLSVAAPTEANGDRTVLDRHLERYTAKNTFDYFIHKDLGGFLRRQLDLYLNTEVLNLDDLEMGDAERLDRALARTRAVRRIGGKIITFLAQLEDFQKRLWLKKKFVLESQWCVTLDQISDSLYPEIAANEAQREEWVRLFAIDTIAGDLGNGGAGYSAPLTVEFLRANPFLVLDTKHFGRDFTDRLLAVLSDAGSLCDQQDGLFIHGENFQALNLLRARYHGQVDCVYIDPPYNTGYSEILYKNTFKHSSWLSLMQGRLELSRELTTAAGSHIIAIDENEQERLGVLLSVIFPDHERICTSVVHNKKGIQGSFFSYIHDYAFFCIPPSRGSTNPLPIPAEEQRFDNLRKWGRESERSTARNCFYPIEVENGRIVSFGEVCAEDFHPGQANVPKGNSILVYPVDAKGKERKWRYARDSVGRISHLLRVKTVNGTGEIQIEKCQSERQVKTVWDDSRYIAGDYGTRWLTNLGLKVEENLYPKSLHAVEDAVALVCDDGATVVDYFAGSGTTGHAVMELNRADGGHRKVVLVEMGEHFDAVLVPRMKKTTYSRKWKNGQPVGREGVTRMFRYIRIESYEDTMEALERVPPTEAGRRLLEADSEAREDYHLRYALGEETNGSACLLGREFRDPFTYTLSVVRDGERREVPVDLPTTFEFLLGLRVAARRRIEGVLAVAGMAGDGRRTLVLWRNLDDLDGKALDGWFERHRDTVAEGVEIIYTNGDHSLNCLRRKGETWVAETLDRRFRELMFPNEP